MGDNDKSMLWFEKAFEERNGELVFLKGELDAAVEGDSMSRLGSDPKLINLLEKMKLPQSPTQTQKGSKNE